MGLPEPVWVAGLEALSGIKEVVGGRLNPQIAQMFRHTRFPLDQLTSKTAWCAAAINWALENSGYRGTRSAAAKSFANYGVEIEPQYGAIAYFGPGSADAGGTGHVTFVIGVDHDSLYCLGGNQSNTIKRTWYPRSRMLACRYPSSAEALAQTDAH